MYRIQKKENKVNMQTILKQLRSKYYKNGLSASARIG
jgi:hypothetical protein